MDKLIKLKKFYNEPTTKYNVISCVIFRMIDGYKNEYNYYDGLNLLTKIFEKLYPGCYLRIYYDQSVLNNKTATNQKFINNTEKLWKPLFQKMKLNKKIQLCEYELKDFKTDEYNHEGVIGTIVRFMPFIDLEENKNIEDVICTDIDFKYTDHKLLQEFYIEFKKSKKQYFYRSKFCYYLQDRFDIIKKYISKIIKHNLMMAGNVISSVKIPQDIFVNFLICLLNENNKGCEMYKDFLGLTHNYSRKNLSRLRYGIDELLTIDILRYLIDNNIKLLVYKEKDFEKLTYNIYLNYEKKKLSEKRFEKIIKYISGKYYDDNKSSIDNFKYIDNIIYRNSSEENNLIYYYVLLRLRDFIQNLINKNKLEKYLIKEDEIECIENINTKEEYFAI